MVFLSISRWSRRLRHLDTGPNKGSDEYYRKRNIFRLSAHYLGRARNCYSNAVRRVQRALVYATKGRKLKREDMRDAKLGLASPLYHLTCNRCGGEMLSRLLHAPAPYSMWTTRVSGSCEELGIPFTVLKKGLESSNIFLNRKSLSDLAIWEPRTFKALTDIAWSRAAEDGLNDVRKIKSDPPDHVVTRGMLRKKQGDS